ncbi:MAG: glycoside hydrolase family 16 protein [Methylococcales bacterium]
MVCLALDTHNPSAITPGDSFFGSEIFTHERFSRGSGCRVEARARLVSPIAKGLVGGIFHFEYFPATGLHSEIDFEFLSNSPDKVQTNVYSNEPFGAGHFAFAGIPGLDLTRFNTYRFDWLPSEVRWYINNQLIHNESISPNEDLSLHLNIWAPACDWAVACDPKLTPASRPQDNVTYYFCVDWVRVSDVPRPDVDFRSSWKRILIR